MDEIARITTDIHKTLENLAGTVWTGDMIILADLIQDICASQKKKNLFKDPTPSLSQERLSVFVNEMQNFERILNNTAAPSSRFIRFDVDAKTLSIYQLLQKLYGEKFLSGWTKGKKIRDGSLKPFKSGHFIWESNFGANCFVSFSNFATILYQYIPDSELISFIFDYPKSNFITPIRFAKILSTYGNLKTIGTNLTDILNHPAFQGFLTLPEATKYLQNTTITGTYLFFINFITYELQVTYYNGTNITHPLQTLSKKGKFTFGKKTSSNVLDVLCANNDVFKKPFINPLWKRKEFYGLTLSIEVPHTLKNQSEGSYLIRFSSKKDYTFSFVPPKGEVQHVNFKVSSEGGWSFQNDKKEYKSFDELVLSAEILKNPINSHFYEAPKTINLQKKNSVDEKKKSGLKIFPSKRDTRETIGSGITLPEEFDLLSSHSGSERNSEISEKSRSQITDTSQRGSQTLPKSNFASAFIPQVLKPNLATPDKDYRNLSKKFPVLNATQKNRNTNNSEVNDNQVLGGMKIDDSRRLSNPNKIGDNDYEGLPKNEDFQSVSDEDYGGLPKGPTTNPPLKPSNSSIIDDDYGGLSKRPTNSPLKPSNSSIVDDDYGGLPKTNSSLKPQIKPTMVDDDYGGLPKKLTLTNPPLKPQMRPLLKSTMSDNEYGGLPKKPTSTTNFPLKPQIKPTMVDDDYGGLPKKPLTNSPLKPSNSSIIDEDYGGLPKKPTTTNPSLKPQIKPTMVDDDYGGLPKKPTLTNSPLKPSNSSIIDEDYGGLPKKPTLTNPPLKPSNSSIIDDDYGGLPKKPTTTNPPLKPQMRPLLKSTISDNDYGGLPKKPTTNFPLKPQVKPTIVDDDYGGLPKKPTLTNSPLKPPNSSIIDDDYGGLPKKPTLTNPPLKPSNSSIIDDDYGGLPKKPTTTNPPLKPQMRPLLKSTMSDNEYGGLPKKSTTNFSLKPQVKPTIVDDDYGGLPNSKEFLFQETNEEPMSTNSYSSHASETNNTIHQIILKMSPNISNRSTNQKGDTVNQVGRKLDSLTSTTPSSPLIKQTIITPNDKDYGGLPRKEEFK